MRPAWVLFRSNSPQNGSRPGDVALCCPGVSRARTALCGLVLAWAFAGHAAEPAGKWRVAFFHDEKDSSFSIQDLRFSSPRSGMALGTLVRKGRARPSALVTNDGGKNWHFVSLKEEGLSLFLLNEGHGWMVGGDGVWKTTDGGESFQRLSKLRGLVRLHFLDEQRGFAVGAPKKIWRTTDGGKHWDKVDAADQPQSNPERSIYTWIDFPTPQLGFITGWHEPERYENLARFPPWMDPKRAQRMRLLPSLTLNLQTTDGGKTWQSSSSSIFGKITRLRLLPGLTGLALVEYGANFEFPSEVYRVDVRKHETKSAFRTKDRAVTDFVILPGGQVVLAAIEPPGTVRELPLPGKLHMLHSSAGGWTEMPVDYRAEGQRAVMSLAPGGSVWAATDMGMILEWNGVRSPEQE
ncbi:MAG: hypothetical protein JJE04_22580 [Acidobacteriia bacterium]|nr:hypothetical protein [Terriglobia bacterium]